jgi:hypothetical protein
MTAPTRTASWTVLLASAVAHDINNFVHGVSTARTLIELPAAATADVDGMAATIEADLQRLGKLGMRLRTLASAAESTASARLDEACEEALSEVDHGPEHLPRVQTIPATLRVVGTAVAVKTVIASLLEHVLAASPRTATVQLAVVAPDVGDPAASSQADRRPLGSPVIVEIAAPKAVALGAIGRARLDSTLATTLPELRGDTNLVLAGAIADRLGATVYIASDPQTGLVLEVHFVADPG